MLKNAQTKVIAPVVTLGLVLEYVSSGNPLFSDGDVRRTYESAVRHMTSFLGHDVHIGAKYYDAYGSRMGRYGVLEQVSHLRYKLSETFCDEAGVLVEWIPRRLKVFIEDRLGVVPQLADPELRLKIAAEETAFIKLVNEHLDKSPVNFEIFTFAVLKVHLERFACRIYRDTRASAHDRGVDISTNFGVVYQIKKLRIHTEREAAEIYTELKANFDSERLNNGSVIVIIEDISKSMKEYLVNMKVQSLSKADVRRMSQQFEDPEDRQKVLRIIYEEFRREYSSRLSLIAGAT